MPRLSLEQIFGVNYEFDIDPGTNTYRITLDLRDFRNIEEGGGIRDGLGISDLNAFATGLQNDEKAEALLYCLILMTSQNQGTDINEDIEQKIFISEGGTRIGVGARSGQIQRVANVNIFQDANIGSLPDIDEV